MARRSQCSSAGDNPLDPNYLPPHYREEYRIAIDALVEEDLEGYYKFIQNADVVDFLSTTEIEFIQSCVQAPQQSHHPEQHFVETGGDGSSDTYWPIHSDLEVPGLDLGWPQLHPFIEPTEVTTLVNPPEPDMPSIKEQARRLIKNAQQVIAVVMDMFTDVDMFADILNAAMRNVAVYILLDEQNAHHFVNMVSNCRVNLQSIQFLRVRTVSGITYHCRSGKSFKGQMMDRFLLTDCRAVLSGNYSFMWSFEKLHRCMAHLFLGQLVATFDEEFRILFAQSQPLVFENVTTQIADLSLLQKRQYPSERTSLYRDTRKFLSLDTLHPEDRVKHSYDERMDPDWRMVALKKQASLHGPSDMYSRFPPRLDPPFDQGPSRTPKMENAFKRHSYAEGVHGKFSYPFLQQQGTPEPENQGRQFHRGHQPYPGPGPEADYSGYDKFWGQDCHSADQYSEPGLPQEMQPPDNFDPVLNYLSSTRNVDFDQGPDKLDLPFGSSHPRRLSLGQPYACQTSPTTSNPPDQKQFVQEPNTDRKDPTVKRGLRNWRISSYLSAYDNPEDLPLGPVQASDPFEETSNPIQQTAPAIDVSFPKIPNVREFKVPAIPRASQMPNYIKNIREKPKKSPDEPPAVATETKITPTPSDSSSTTEGEKTEEVEQKEPKTIGLRREESFRRKYNAAVPRSSRLRSSLIFSSLEQQHSSQDEGSEANEAEQTKLPFVSQVLGQRRSATREPIEWSRFIKSATDASKQDDGTGKADDKDTSKEENEQESVKSPDTEQTDPSPSTPRSKASKAQQPKTDQPAKPLLTAPVTVDMSDPDNRLMFFKELAAKRKAAKAAEAEKCKDKALVKPPTDLKTTTVKREKPEPKEDSEKMATTPPSAGLSPKNVPADEANKAVPTETEACESDASDKTNKYDSHVKNDSGMSQSYKEEETTIPTDSKKTELKKQPATSQSVSAETGSPPSKQDHKTVAKESSPLHRPTPANVPSLTGGTDEGGSSNLCSTSKGTISLSPTSVEVPSSASAALNSNIESAQLETSITSSALQPEQPTGSEFSSSDPSALLSTPKDTSSSNATPKDSSSPTSSSILSPNSAKIGAQESAYESTQAHPAPVSPLMPPEAPSAVVSALKTSDISPATYAASEEENTCSSQFTTESTSEESCAPTPSEKHLADSENNSAVEALAPSSHKSGLTTVSDLESSTPRPSETCPAVSVSPKASQPTTSASHQDARMQVTPPSELNLTRSVIPAPVETVCSSPLTDSDGSVMLPKAEKTDTNMSTSCPSDTPSVPKQIRTDSNKPSVFPSTKTEPNSEIPTEPEPTSGSVASQSQPSEPPVPAENSKEDHQSEVSKEPELTNSGEKRPEDREAINKVDKSTTYESVKSEKTNDQVRQNNCLEPAEITSEEVPLSPQSKQTKPTHSRYHSSTANVLSSSNLRDDTKLLLEQISANSQCRNEATKESPVTDDEKEDEADKNAKREKERGIRTPSKGEPKSSQEKDKLLEKFQSMRKERKVYSRFEYFTGAIKVSCHFYMMELVEKHDKVTESMRNARTLKLQQLKGLKSSPSPSPSSSSSSSSYYLHP